MHARSASANGDTHCQADAVRSNGNTHSNANVADPNSPFDQHAATACTYARVRRKSRPGRHPHPSR